MCDVMIPDVVLRICFECVVINPITVIKLKMSNFVITVTIHVEAAVYLFVKFIYTVWRDYSAIRFRRVVDWNQKVIVRV